MGLGSLFSRFRSEPYYKKCERRLERLENETFKLKARCDNRAATVQKIKGRIVLYAWILTCVAAAYASWVYGQPEGTYTPLGSASRVSLIIVLPSLSYVMHTSIGWLVSLRDAWDKRSLTKLNRKRMDMLKDLKETAQFENIFAVIRKYDPEERKKADLLEKLKKEEFVPRQRTSNSTIPSGRSGFVATTTKGLMANTGKMIMPVLDTLANSVIGDNPALLEEVRSLQRRLSDMHATNVALEMELKKLRAEDVGSSQGSSQLMEDLHEQHHRKGENMEIMEQGSDKGSSLDLEDFDGHHSDAREIELADEIAH
ncbi:hypothetical protein BSKO_01006 [Bryopsis sp. KO-2023]|nr:hypothetical protein BSKO_01006 [Bryopsis sp. KO-2023]